MLLLPVLPVRRCMSYIIVYQSCAAFLYNYTKLYSLLSCAFFLCVFFLFLMSRSRSYSLISGADRMSTDKN